MFKEKNEYSSARDYLARAIDALELTRSRLREDTLKKMFAASAQDVYSEMIDLLVKTGNVEEGFNYLERSRARAFLDILAEEGQQVDQWRVLGVEGSDGVTHSYGFGHQTNLELEKQALRRGAGRRGEHEKEEEPPHRRKSTTVAGRARRLNKFRLIKARREFRSIMR